MYNSHQEREYQEAKNKVAAFLLLVVLAIIGSGVLLAVKLGV